MVLIVEKLKKKKKKKRMGSQFTLYIESAKCIACRVMLLNSFQTCTVYPSLKITEYNFMKYKVTDAKYTSR